MPLTTISDVILLVMSRTSISDTMLFQLTKAKLSSQKVYFGGLVGILKRKSCKVLLELKHVSCACISTDIASFQNRFTMFICVWPFSVILKDQLPGKHSVSMANTSEFLSACQPREIHIVSAFILSQTPFVIAIISVVIWHIMLVQIYSLMGAITCRLDIWSQALMSRNVLVHEMVYLFMANESRILVGGNNW